MFSLQNDLLVRAARNVQPVLSVLTDSFKKFVGIKKKNLQIKFLEHICNPNSVLAYLRKQVAWLPVWLSSLLDAQHHQMLLLTFSSHLFVPHPLCSVYVKTLARLARIMQLP